MSNMQQENISHHYPEMTFFNLMDIPATNDAIKKLIRMNEDMRSGRIERMEDTGRARFEKLRDSMKRALRRTRPQRPAQFSARDFIFWDAANANSASA